MHYGKKTSGGEGELSQKTDNDVTLNDIIQNFRNKHKEKT